MKYEGGEKRKVFVWTKNFFGHKLWRAESFLRATNVFHRMLMGRQIFFCGYPFRNFHLLVKKS